MKPPIHLLCLQQSQHGGSGASWFRFQKVRRKEEVVNPIVELVLCDVPCMWLHDSKDALSQQKSCMLHPSTIICDSQTSSFSNMRPVSVLAMQ